MVLPSAMVCGSRYHIRLVHGRQSTYTKSSPLNLLCMVVEIHVSIVSKSIVILVTKSVTAIPQHHQRREEQCRGVGKALAYCTISLVDIYANTAAYEPAISGAEPCTASKIDASCVYSAYMKQLRAINTIKAHTLPMLPDGVRPKPPIRPAHMSDKISP